MRSSLIFWRYEREEIDGSSTRSMGVKEIRVVHTRVSRGVCTQSILPWHNRLLCSARSAHVVCGVLCEGPARAHRRLSTP
eukprot:3792071-Rhodomonas_salina.1